MKNPKFYLSTISLLSASVCFVSADFQDASKRQTSLEWCSKFEAFEQEFLSVLDKTGFQLDETSLFPQSLKDQCNQAKDMNGLSTGLYDVMTELQTMGTWVFESLFPVFYKIYHPNGEAKNNYTECAAYFDQKYDQVRLALSKLAYNDSDLNTLLQVLIQKMDNATVDLNTEDKSVLFQQLEARRLTLLAGTTAAYNYLQGCGLSLLLGLTTDETTTPTTETPTEPSTDTTTTTDTTQPATDTSATTTNESSDLPADTTPAPTSDTPAAAEPTTTTDTQTASTDATPAEASPATDDSSATPANEAKTVTPMSSAKSDSNEDEFNYDEVTEPANPDTTEDVPATTTDTTTSTDATEQVPTTPTDTATETQPESTEAKTDL